MNMPFLSLWQQTVLLAVPLQSSQLQEGRECPFLATANECENIGTSDVLLKSELFSSINAVLVQEDARRESGVEVQRWGGG